MNKRQRQKAENIGTRCKYARAEYGWRFCLLRNGDECRVWKYIKNI